MKSVVTLVLGPSGFIHPITQLAWLSIAPLGDCGVPKAASKALMICLGETAGGIREGTPKYAASLAMASRLRLHLALMSCCVDIVAMMTC